ncbi:MAG: response regulator [Nanoarchaeota archaeon]|nr:response regulator [Nanoarchaeota archaeon]MCK5630805.1 response regulator [Nanoarchaeota archaeon]
MVKKIMVVDDEQDILELVKVILESQGFEVLVFINAKEALVELETGKCPDLLILDIRMPQISGYDFCKIVRKNKKLDNLKIAVFTASSNLGQSFLELNHNVIGFISKPFDNKKLVLDVKKYLGIKEA